MDSVAEDAPFAIAVQGPRSDNVHYVVSSQHSPLPDRELPTLCGRQAPAIGWHLADDHDINNSTAGICERCMRLWVGPMH